VQKKNSKTCTLQKLNARNSIAAMLRYELGG